MMKSLRAFLIIMTVSVICLTNFSAALQGYRDSSKAIDKLLQRQVEEKLSSLVALLEYGEAVPGGLFSADNLFQVWRDDELLYRSENAPDSRFFPADGNTHIVSYEGMRWFGEGMRSEALGMELMVASRFRIYSDLTEEILIRAIVPIIWILPVVGLLVWIVIYFGLRPLKQLANNLSRRDANNFYLLEEEPYNSELMPIVRALNSLFSRLGEAFERERRFSADAAHELRTPLAALKVNLHNLSRTVPASDELEGLQRTADRMEHCIEQLLTLHRASIKAGEAELEPCDLHRIAQEVIAELFDAVDARQQQIELKGQAAWVLAEVSSLAILIRNLIGNASKYSPEQGTISVSVEQHQGQVELRVEDSGPGIDKAEYAKVIEPFYRVGGDQHASKVTGSGLGLSIVAFIAELYQGQLELSRSATLGGLAVVVRFPLYRKEGV